VGFIKDQVPEVEYTTKVTESQAKPEENKEMVNAEARDEEFSNAVKVIVNAQKGSASLLQRKLSIGYNKAARLLDEMEELGVVAPAIGSKPRNVLITDADAFLASLSGPTSAPAPVTGAGELSPLSQTALDMMQETVDDPVDMPS
jgi:S-DNA-T family DNA segregation ATPase FtsK/SpoIIIE